MSEQSPRTTTTGGEPSLSAGVESVAPVDVAPSREQVDPAAARENRLERWLRELTIADGLMALILLVAAIVRFGQLQLVPLSPSEAEAALASWQFWHREPVTAAISSPAYFTLTNGLLPFLGDSDAVVRFVPALFGLALVALPWWLRRQWHSVAILTTALFLALSPLNIFASRLAGGQAISVFALMLLLVAFLRARQVNGYRWPITGGIALALGLTSDPVFYSGLMTLIPAWLLGGGGGTNEGSSRTTPLGGLGVAAVTGGVAFLALSSSFLLYPQAIGASFRVATTWLAQFGWPAASSGSFLDVVLAPLAALVRYEPALLLLGVPALIWVLYSRRGEWRWLATWVALLLLVALLQTGTLPNAIVLTLPGYLLIGLLAAHLATSRDPAGETRVTVLVAGGLALLGAVLLVSLARFTRLGLWSSDQAALVGLATVALVAAGAVVVLALSYDQSAARLGAFIGLAVWVLYAQWGLSYQLAQPGANDPRELWIQEATDSDIMSMNQLLADISRQVTNSADGLEIISLVDSPVLAWYLRDFDRLQFASAVPLQTVPQAVITSIETELRLSADYMGADYGLGLADSELVFDQSLPDRLKWWLFRESPIPVKSDPVILWVRSDLVEP